MYQEDGKTYRKYEVNPSNSIEERVKNHYYNQHRLQTVAFVEEMVRRSALFVFRLMIQFFKHRKWLSFNHGSMQILEALDVLANFLDESDPDVCLNF